VRTRTVKRSNIVQHSHIIADKCIRIIRSYRAATRTSDCEYVMLSLTTVVSFRNQPVKRISGVPYIVTALGASCHSHAAAVAAPQH